MFVASSMRHVVVTGYHTAALLLNPLSARTAYAARERSDAYTISTEDSQSTDRPS